MLPLAADAADVAGVFADGMVIQREMSVPIWGTGSPGEAVTVRFGGQEKTCAVDAAGRWRVSLDPMPASPVNRPLTVVSAAGEKRFSDVLVGEVWFVSGQSNMEVPLCQSNPHMRDRQGATIAQITTMPNVRYVLQSNYCISTVPETNPPRRVEWLRCTPENLMKKSFSAVGFYFAYYLHQATDIPVGLIGAWWGGTGIDAWTPREGTLSRPDLADIARFTPRMDWDGRTPKPFFQLNRRQDQPGVLFNEMVNPWCPYAIRGLVWYQGELNSREPQRYCSKMHALLNGWTEKFENPNLKIYFAQVAPWGSDRVPALQEAQAKFESEQPRAGMAVINDVGCLTDIHPAEKGTVGLRLALHALKRDCGMSGIEDCSPKVRSWKTENGAFVLTFDHAKRLYLYNEDFSRVTPFELAGADGVFKPATIENLIVESDSGARKECRGRIEGGPRLVIRAEGVPDPKRLRYCHSRPWKGTVYNEVNLPLGAFHIGY